MVSYDLVELAKEEQNENEQILLKWRKPSTVNLYSQNSRVESIVLIKKISQTYIEEGINGKLMFLQGFKEYDLNEKIFGRLLQETLSLLSKDPSITPVDLVKKYGSLFNQEYDYDTGSTPIVCRLRCETPGDWITLAENITLALDLHSAIEKCKTDEYIKNNDTFSFLKEYLQAKRNKNISPLELLEHFITLYSKDNLYYIKAFVSKSNQMIKYTQPLDLYSLFWRYAIDTITTPVVPWKKWERGGLLGRCKICNKIDLLVNLDGVNKSKKSFDSWQHRNCYNKVKQKNYRDRKKIKD
jgi:hypothetical protein